MHRELIAQPLKAFLTLELDDDDEEDFFFFFFFSSKESGKRPRSQSAKLSGETRTTRPMKHLWYSSCTSPFI